MHSRTGAFDIPQHEQVTAFNLVARPRRFAQKFQAGRHAWLTLKAAYRNALTQFIPTVMFRQRCHDGLQRYPMKRVAQLLRTGPGFLNHLFFNLPRTGTWVTTVGRTASGDTVLGGDVSFFGFLTILLVFC